MVELGTTAPETARVKGGLKAFGTFQAEVPKNKNKSKDNIYISTIKTEKM